MDYGVVEAIAIMVWDRMGSKEDGVRKLSRVLRSLFIDAIDQKIADRLV